MPNIKALITMAVTVIIVLAIVNRIPALKSITG